MIRRAIVKDAKEISKLMLADLERPHPKFPKPMIEKFRNHAQIESINNEFGNPDMIALIFENKNKILGFVVGYKEDDKAFLHYVSGPDKKIKLELINAFERECSKLDLKEIKTDTFEFMENKKIFEEAGFKFFKAENLTPNLKMLWYKKRLIPNLD